VRQIAEYIAVLACGLFTGAAAYVSVVEHPARRECGVEIAVAEFASSYRRATIMQVTLAAVGPLASICAWLAGATLCWLVGGLVLVAIIPFTLIFILPTNKRLLSSSLDKSSAETTQLLACWGMLHAVRTVLSTLALLVFLWILIFKKSQ
jgi:hypothetical protein